jgi:hypothetical protein
MLYLLPVVIVAVFLIFRARRYVRAEAERAVAFLASREPAHGSLLVSSGRGDDKRMSLIATAYLQGMQAGMPHWLVRRAAHCYTRGLLRNPH